MKVCVDPGHGMSNRQTGVFDPGATHIENGFLFREADIALRYGLSLKDVFRANGIDVFMTRDDSADHAPVGTRASMAKAAGCDVFISLHLNDFDDDSANGLEVLFRDTDDKALAQKLQEALVKVTKMKDRKIKQRTDLAVLKFQGPAVLIELGFIANDGDRVKLLAAQVRDAVTRKIATTTMEHLGLAQ
jgi:N-acetylmuramoyl-L-alanine amidase